MSLRRLTAFVVAVVLIALGVFFMGVLATTGGTTTVDMTQFGERWLES